ncbi:type VI secretion system tip protein VgrG [Escherichia coli]|nr:type VI secretion system tip protein VgrG [Escherichia coli]
MYDYPGRFKGAHGQNFARWQMDGWRNNAETARGMSRSPEIWPGRRIVLTGHPQANLNREWQVVASELHGEQPQAVPGRQGAGTALENHFAVIPADRTWRPQPLLKPLVDGPQSAVVTGPAGEEIFCDEHGRVRVKFNWDRYNPSNQDSSCWIRVAQAWAGTGFGHLAIPRVGQEVIVDFLNGDPDQPIIMGRTYHQENRPPGSLPGTKTQMTIRSKTYMGSGFNELKFDDATGREQVYIHAQKNMDTEVLNDRTTTVKHDHRETVKNDQTVTIQEGNRLLTVEKGHKITGVLKGSLSEDVFQDRGTIAGSVHVDAVNNGGEGDGIQAYTAIKEILLAVEESKIALTPDGIQLQVGESTVIRLSKDGITIVGGSVFINWFTQIIREYFMQFTFNEGHIQLPSQWQDQSMQVLVSTDNSGINLVITREAVPQGTLTPELYQETLALYQGKLDGYTEHACREITLAEAPAWLLDYSWNGPEDEGNQGRISQIAVFQRRGDTLLTFTFSTSLSLKNSQKTMLLEVIKSFTPLPPENDIQKDQPR